MIFALLAIPISFIFTVMAMVELAFNGPNTALAVGWLKFIAVLAVSLVIMVVLAYYLLDPILTYTIGALIP